MESEGRQVFLDNAFATPIFQTNNMTEKEWILLA